jgi:GT2 family glycosyltransferase
MTLAVILLNWHHETQTLACAAAVLSWKAIEPRLFVVDNESTPASRRALAADLPAGSLICSAANLGYGGGNNLGIKQALGAGVDHVLLLNADAAISPDAVTRLLRRLEADPAISILGPVIKEMDGGRPRLLAGGRSIARHLSTRISMRPEDVRTLPGYPLAQVDYVPGMVLLARASLFEEIGLLDEEFFFSGEIADFCARARQRGHKVCIDLEVEAEHDLGRTPTTVRETLHVYYGLRNRFLYVRKHHAPSKIGYFVYWTMIAGAVIARALWRGRWGRARAVGWALVDAWSDRYGNRNAIFPVR